MIKIKKFKRFTFTTIKKAQNNKNASSEQNESTNNINRQNTSQSSTTKENTQPPINKEPISEYHALNEAKIYAKNI